MMTREPLRSLILLSTLLVPGPLAGVSGAVPPASAPGTVPAAIVTGAEARIVVVADLDQVAADGGRAVFSGHPLTGVMVHGFRAELVDSAGGVVTHAPAWHAALLSAGSGSPLILLNAGVPELLLPRPLGFRLDGDSLLLEVRLDSAGAHAGLRLRLTVLYEPLDVASRLPVLPLRPVLRGAGTVSARSSWEFEAAVTGRIMALVGLRFAAAGELVLEDVMTGAVVWRARMHGGEGLPQFVQPGEVVRVGAAIERGVRYRLTAIGSAADNGVLAMVLPNRGAVVAAGSN